MADAPQPAHDPAPEPPRVFVSYSWTTPAHQDGVRDLATEFRSAWQLGVSGHAPGTYPLRIVDGERRAGATPFSVVRQDALRYGRPDLPAMRVAQGPDWFGGPTVSPDS